MSESSHLGTSCLRKGHLFLPTGTNWPPGPCVPRPWQRACCLVGEAAPRTHRFPLRPPPSRKLTCVSHTPSQARGREAGGAAGESTTHLFPSTSRPQDCLIPRSNAPGWRQESPNLQAPHSPSCESVLGRGWVCTCLHARPRVCGHHPGATAKLQLK